MPFMVIRVNLNLRKMTELALQEEGLRRAASIANLLLVVALAYSLVQFIWHVLPAPTVQAPPPAPPMAGPTHGAAAQRVPEDVAHWHLFGIKPAADSSPVPSSAPLPETKLNLILRGVVAGSAPADSGAIIAEPSGQEEFYGIEAALPGGAILKEVYSDRVVLMRNGRLETLRLPVDQLSEAGTSQGIAPTGRAASARGGRAVSGQPSLREYRDMLLNDPRSVVAADLVRILPYNKGGRFGGYEVRPGRDAATLTRFGLRAGDVVTAVNGVPLNTPAAGLGILRDLRDAKQVRLDVQRNGVPQTIVLNLN